MAESRGMLIIRTGDTSILFRAALFDASNAKVTAGTTNLRIWHVVPTTGALEAYDFDDDTFKTTALTTGEATMTHQTVDNSTYNTGVWTLRHSTLAAFTKGDKYIAEVENAGAIREIHLEFQYGDCEGDQRVDLPDDVWDEDIVAAHTTADTAGRALAVLDAISDRANNANLNAILGVPDVAANTIAETLWDEDITAHVTASSAGAALDALGTAIDGRSNNANLNALLGVADTASFTIAETIWDEDIVAAHGTSDTAGLLLRALGAEISQRTNNLTLNDLLGVPDTAATDTVAGQVWEELVAGHNTASTMGEVMNDIVTAGFPTVASISDGVWDEDIVSAHGTADTSGLLLRALGAVISQRSNNATLNALLAVPDVAANTIAETIWDEDITTHVASSSAGGALDALGTAIDGRSNNANLNALLGVADTASFDIAHTVWDELTASHSTANSAGQRLEALDLLLEAAGAGDAAAILTQVNKLDATALSGAPDADSVAGKLNALSTTLATVDRDIVSSVNLEGANLRIEVAAEQYGVIQTTPYTQASAQIFDEANSIIATIGTGDFGAITARGFFQFTLSPHPLVAGATYQIQCTLTDGGANTYQSTKLFKVVNV